MAFPLTPLRRRAKNLLGRVVPWDSHARCTATVEIHESTQAGERMADNLSAFNMRGGVSMTNSKSIRVNDTAKTVAALRMKARDALIVADVLVGQSRKDVAEKYGISQARVRELMLAEGIRDSAPAAKNADRDAAIFAALDKGKKPTEVCAEFKVSERRLNTLLLGRSAKVLPKKKTKV
jgi:ribosomal protein S9